MSSKIFLVFFIGLSFNSGVFAQVEFAPIGAKWYYNASNDPGFGNLLIIEVVGEEEVGGKLARKLELSKIRSRWTPEEIIWDTITTTEYIYSRQDTVYHYDLNSEEYYTLYLFDVKPKDTITLREDFYWRNQLRKSFQFVIDSIENKDVNSRSLSFIYSTPTYESDWIYSYSFVRKYPLIINIGSTMNFFGIPIDNYLADHGGEYFLRCYRDGDFIYKHDSWIDYDCDYLPGFPTSVSDKINPEIRIYPNPAIDRVTVSGFSGQVTNFELFNVLGLSVLQGKLTSEITIDIAELPSGYYKLVLSDRSNRYGVFSLLKI